MKSNILKLTVIATISAFALANTDKKLKINAQGKFKFVQFTDIHFGESPEQDLGSQNVMRKVLELEKPDFAVVTGDVVSGYMWDGITDGWYAEQFKTFVKPLYEHNMNWALTAGNHDTQGDLNREQVSELDRTYNLSMTKPNAPNISHAFNYMLPVYDQSGQNISFRLWFIDSGEDQDCMGVGGYDCVRPDQIEWFRQQNKAIPESDPTKGKGFLFVHIPLSEYINLYNNDQFYGKRQEDICCWAVNTGLFGALKEQKTVEWVTVGHDHNNDYYGNYDGINLAYGRKTGYACYGPDNMQRGARVFEVTLNPYKIETWVRQEDGTIHKELTPNSKPANIIPQTKCGGALQKANNINEHDVELRYLREYYLKRADLQHLIPQALKDEVIQ
ncbi:metallophosphoesterase [Stylonychia lemnae]|uniref:Metallophosphoesterase n=1 Tax=Stylonychia lemnae TaxID=5949 RepID=A0A078B1F2_STYLE|nr:metallophosphoesterase [Stylonychia lemnae]|eukprot:CDW88364.1 metallophosphoesterase [Stylonychia lemnae]